MARAVERALRDERPLCVEAGTGTGKTLAYLVPALLSGKRVVVSTATRTLQEQIVRKDVPLLRAALDDALPAPIEAVCLKGLSNYLCVRRLGEARRARTGLLPVADADFALVDDFAARTTTGDRAELTDLPESARVWQEVLSSPETRIGARCPEVERCFVTRARRAAARAQLVVVNHHLYFADLALRDAWPGAQVVPPHDAVIFDEAHQIEEIATQFFGVGVSAHRAATLAADARRALSAAGDGRAAALADHVEATGADLFRSLFEHLAPRPAPGAAATAEPARVLAPDDLFDGGRRAAWLRLDTALDELVEHTRRVLGAMDEDLADPTPREALLGLVRRAAALRDDLAVVADRGAERGHVYWAEARGPRSVLLQASPVDVGPILRERLFARPGTVVLTSATLAPGGDFSFLRARTGLDREDTETLALASPFDYPRRALLYCARDLPEPSDGVFPAACAARVRELCALSAGRAFVLFTSYRNLDAVTALLRRDPPPHPLYVQGEQARSALLDAFRERPGLLLATASFWEGVDVPGEALSLVVIDRLPFDPPDDPLHHARCARLAEAGADPFSTYQVPRAALHLRQGFGRLLRTAADRGVVAVLDRRLMTRGYGRAFLAALPPARRSTDMNDVRRFFGAAP